MLVYVVGGYLASIPHAGRTAIKVALPLFLLLSTAVCGRVERLRPWKPVCLALLAASCGFLLAWVLSDRILAALGVTPRSVPGVAMAKLVESVLIVVAVLLVARAGGMSQGDLYLKRGNVRAWLPIGIATFGAFLAIFLWQSSQRGSRRRRCSAGPRGFVVFVFANAFMEELHFRGLLLRPFEGQLGVGGANLCIALFFTLAHAPVKYVPNIVPFLVVLFALAWAWGFIIQRTEALWGAVLFHAGADLLIVMGIFATYGAV